MLRLMPPIDAEIHGFQAQELAGLHLFAPPWQSTVQHVAVSLEQPLILSHVTCYILKS